MAGLLELPGYDEERLRRVSEQLPCRELQAGLLLSLMGQLPHVTVSCVECVSVALLFEKVLQSFFGGDAASLLPRSPSLSDFVRIYRQQSSQSPAKQTRYIVSRSQPSLIIKHLKCPNL
ncbi:hypothetical protein XENOCAPTIV_019958 [Xenoophorus captivus]|uniref:Uncharacterized protein n=1 Tax=Xenoophorus captivus TaxID=1517983 RepID=A0ABV0RVA0_9TELE